MSKLVRRLERSNGRGAREERSARDSGDPRQSWVGVKSERPRSEHDERSGRA